MLFNHAFASKKRNGTVVQACEDAKTMPTEKAQNPTIDNES